MVNKFFIHKLDEAHNVKQKKQVRLDMLLFIKSSTTGKTSLAIIFQEE
jgi:hypothetical protein